METFEKNEDARAIIFVATREMTVELAYLLNSFVGLKGLHVATGRLTSNGHIFFPVAEIYRFKIQYGGLFSLHETYLWKEFQLNFCKIRAHSDGLTFLEFDFLAAYALLT